MCKGPFASRNHDHEIYLLHALLPAGELVAGGGQLVAQPRDLCVLNNDLLVQMNSQEVGKTGQSSGGGH